MSGRIVTKKVQCLECGNIWRAMFPYSTDTSKLECPMCHNQRSRVLTRSEKDASKYINADELMEIIKTHHYMLANATNSRDYGMFTTGIEQAISETESVEIVRCKDCKHLIEIDDTSNLYVCDRIDIGMDGEPSFLSPDNDYCSYAERRESK